MNKTEFIADLGTKVEEVISFEPSADPETAISGNTVTEYTARVLETSGLSKARVTNRAFIVVNDGLAGEQAFTQDDIGLPKDDNVSAINYLATYVLGGTLTILGTETVLPAGQRAPPTAVHGRRPLLLLLVW